VRTFIVALFLVFPAAAVAQDSLKLDPTVAFAVSGGHWSAGGAEGAYRVVVRSGGFDHIVSELFVQWLQDPRSENDSVAVRASVKVDSLSGLWSLGQPKFVCSSACHVEIGGTDTHTMEESKWELSLGPPGRVIVRRR
jgi:hypothetical protein